MTRPAWRVTVQGKDQTLELSKRLVSLSITDESGKKADRLDLEVDNSDGFKAPPPGSEIKVWLGYDPKPVYMGSFTVDEWEKSGPRRSISLSAKAAELTTAIRQPRARSYDGQTVGEIVNTIAARHGLKAAVSPAMAALNVPHIDQHNESDLHFLSRLARRCGAIFKLANGQVIFAEKGSGALPYGASKPVLELTPGMVGKWTARAGERGKWPCVICTYMDHDAGRRVSVKVGSGSPVFRDKRTYASAEEATAAANAHHGDAQRGGKTFECSGPGMGQFFAEALVAVTGFDPDADGNYFVKTVKHTLDSSGGWKTSLTMETKAAA